MLQQALQSRLPFVQVKTDDLIHIQKVLSAIAGEPVSPLVIPPETQDPTKIPFSAKGSIYYTGGQAAEALLTAKFYLYCKANDKTVVFVNVKSSVLAYQGGVMFPPKELMAAYLTELLDNEKQANRLLPCYGGLTLKDMYEVTKITKKRVGSVTSAGVNETRQGYLNKLRGVIQVSTPAEEFYRCPPELEEWMDLNSKFFLKPISPVLVPRGLMFDGMPGTGKSSAARYIARRMGIPLYRMDIGGMKGKYVGVSEENLNAALGQIDQLEPCVVIMDEIEKVFTETHDSGVTSSMLSSILWWLQEHKSKVFTVMTTNNKTKIPAELYREGRIDQAMVFSGFGELEEALDFAGEVYAHTVKTIEEKLPSEMPVTEKLKDKMQMHLSNGGTVAHSNVTKEVYDMIKRMIVNGVVAPDVEEAAEAA